MWNDLNGTATVVTAPLFGKDGPVYFSGCDVALFGQALINKALVVSQIQIGLSTIIRHKDLSVLDRIHGTRINVDIGIKFLHRHLIPTHFQKSSQRGSCDSLAESGNDTTGYKNIFYSHNTLHF